MTRLGIDERRVLRAFAPDSPMSNPPRSYEEVTHELPVSAAMPALSSLMSEGYITELEEGYVLTDSGFDALVALQASRLD